VVVARVDGPVEPLRECILGQRHSSPRCELGVTGSSGDAHR
jgi:hypothetical protein